ncbi:MAG: hypothetical protein EXR93_02835 [Gemmatimonadetes bacterium]|nr:hypothetical protein [Gemmatimonadota bacterium]
MMNARTLIGALLLGPVVLLASREAVAQERDTDPRWLPWIGCWAPVEIADSSAAEVERRYRAVLCVIPAAEPSAIEILTIEDGAVTARGHVDAAGRALAAERDGCRGTETADWSPDGVRVYLHSEFTCGSDTPRRASGLMVITPRGDWLDIRGSASGRQRGVRVARYEMASPARETLPAEVIQALEAPALENVQSRDIAGSVITPAQVIEASQRVETRVVEAWLALSVWHGPPVRSKELVDMSSAGVPTSVTDLVVALSYPKWFSLNRPERQADAAAGEHEAYLAGGSGGVYPFYWPYEYNRGYDSYNGYGWYPGGEPVVIVVRDTKTEGEHGQVVNGQGYKAGNSAKSSASSTTNRRNESSSSSSSSETSSSQSSSSSGSDSSERTAHPRP